MGSLQDIIDRSLAKANPGTQAMLADLACSAEELDALINTVRTATIATANTEGRPHAAVVIAACHDDTIYFTVTPSSAMARNLEGRPALAFTITYGDRSIMGQGTGELVGRSTEIPDTIGAITTSARAFTPQGWDGLVYRIEISRIFAG